MLPTSLPVCLHPFCSIHCLVMKASSCPQLHSTWTRRTQIPFLGLRSFSHLKIPSEMLPLILWYEYLKKTIHMYEIVKEKIFFWFCKAGFFFLSKMVHYKPKQTSNLPDPAWLPSFIPWCRWRLCLKPLVGAQLHIIMSLVESIFFSGLPVAL